MTDGGVDLPTDGLERPAPARRRRRLLVMITVAETLSLVVLLVNLVSAAHSDALAAAIGPVHGGLYLAGAVLTLAGRFPRWVKLVAVVSVVGAWLAVARTRDEAAVDG